MIIKGTAVKSRRHAAYLANHLLNANDNEICEVWDIDGHAKPNDLKAAVVDFYDMVKLTRGGKNGLFMLAFNPEIGESMSKEQYFQSISEAEKRFGLEGQPKAIVRHFKEGRDHIHVVWQTTDTETRKIKPNIYYYKLKCMKLARDLELELGHKPVSNEKSRKSYSEKDRERAKIDSTQLKPDARKILIQEAYQNSKDSFEFSKKMSEIGLMTAKGKVGICLIDSARQPYNLEKELKKTVSQEQLTVFFKNQIKALPEVSTLIPANDISTRNKRKLKKMKTQNVTQTERKARYVNFDFDKERINQTAIEAGNNFFEILKDQTANDREKEKQEILKRMEDVRKKKERERKNRGFEL